MTRKLLKPFQLKKKTQHTEIGQAHKKQDVKEITALAVYIRKVERSKVNDLRIYFEKLVVSIKSI